MNASQPIERAIQDAVWEGKINQLTTREVAERFGCSLLVARRHLMRIVTLQSSDARFKAGPEELTALVQDGKMFTFNVVDMRGNPTRLDNALRHYVWFLT